MRQTLYWIKNNQALIIIMVFATALRLYNIDYQSVWLDEVHTLNEANPYLTFSEFVSELMIAEPHPPLYFVLARYCFDAFGHTSIVLRLLSAVIGILGVLAVYFLGREAHSKKAGIYAALLTAVNYFQIYFSQDGRPYPLLFLFTVCSFYFILRFIKSPSPKTAALYGFFAALMIYSHFFALFALVAQALILLYYIYRPQQGTSKKFFVYCVLAGIIIVLLYIPCFPLLLAAAERTSIWIPPPTFDTYLLIFKDFFGHSKIVIYTMLSLMVLYFVMLFKKNGNKDGHDSSNKKYRLTAFVLTVWFVVTVVIPAVRSYVSLPMIISRYFINILPVVIVMAAIALVTIKNNIARNFILAFILFFSLKNLIFDREYYTSISKSQFREVTNFIIERNQLRSPVVTTLNWHYKYFFKDVIQQQIIGSSLDDYVAQMRNDTLLIKPFWYTNSHGNGYMINEENNKFLNEKFNLQSKVALFDAWANYYIPKGKEYEEAGKRLAVTKTPLQVLNLELFSPVSSKNKSGLQFYQNQATKSPQITLQKGTYKLLFHGISYPEKPLNGVNAHFRVRLNGDEIGEFYLGEKGFEKAPTIDFSVPKDMNLKFEVIFDNDELVNGIDRNGVIRGIEIIPD